MSLSQQETFDQLGLVSETAIQTTTRFIKLHKKEMQEATLFFMGDSILAETPADLLFLYENFQQKLCAFKGDIYFDPNAFNANDGLMTDLQQNHNLKFVSIAE